MVDSHRAPLGDFRMSQPLAQVDNLALRSEIDILKSRGLAAAVVDRLQLSESPRGTFFRWLKTLGALVDKELSVLTGSRSDSVTAAERERYEMTGRLQQDLDVINDGRSYTVLLRYAGADPERAALIANTFAAVYLDQQSSFKEQTMDRVSLWLSQRVRQLTAETDAAAAKVEAYRASHDLLRSGQDTIVDQQMISLNNQLSEAENDLVTKRVTLNAGEKMKGGDFSVSDSVLGSPLIHRLREQEAQLSQREQKLRSSYRSDSEELRAFRAQHADVRRMIANEIERFAFNAQLAVAIAAARVDLIKNQLTSLKATMSQANEASIELKQLEQNADASRRLLEEMIGRQKAIEGQKDFILADAHVISPASVPLLPASPKRGILLIVAAIFAVAAGVAAAVITERRRNALFTEQEVYDALRLPLYGSIPHIRKPQILRPIAIATTRNSATEPLNALKARLSRSTGRGAAADEKVFLVTSAIPGEGKSMLATTLALDIAAGNSRCLLVDCDLRKPDVTRLLAGDTGLEELGSEDVWVHSPLAPIVRERHTGLHVVAVRQALSHPSRVLEDSDFEIFLEAARAQYDFVILDGPPVFPAADTLRLSSLADATLFVLRWGQTPKDVAESAIAALRSVGATVIGGILTNVDIRRRMNARAGWAFYYAHYKDSYKPRA